MTKWTFAAVVVAAAAAVGVRAQSGGNTGMEKGKMDNPMANAMTYSGCVAAGSQPGTYLLTHMASDMGTKKDTMGKDAMGKDTMSKDAMPSSMMLMGTKVDFSKHVGHKVSVTGTMEKMDGMGKTDAMAKPGKMPGMGMMVTSMKMMGTSCGM
jgi:hypothetical protein